MVRQVQPLRVSKTGNTPSSTPNKMAATRPLAELGSTNQRRNSPSYNQATRKMIVSRESSPYTENSSPFASTATSPLGLKKMSPFRFDENMPERSPSPSVSPKRRTSIERLKQASRVKNSNIFALETKDAYDPTSMPIVERPSANRPLSQQFANNSFTRFDSLKKENNPVRSPQRPGGHKRSETEIYVPRLSPSREAANIGLPPSPGKQGSPSPTKSAIARTSMFGLSQESMFDPENGTWSDEERAPTPRQLHRHNKSVTFHADPPVVNEYEQQTPEPSVSVDSREGSWESDELEEQDYSFERGSSAEQQDREDSFDADLENADKTPVVLPEDWRRMSPEEARMDLVNQEDDVFDGSPSPQHPVIGRSESVTSDGESRPLPPLPASMTEHKRRDSDSLAAAAERASFASRDLPSPPKRASCSEEDILRMTRESSLSLQDRLQFLGDHANRDRSVSNSSQATEHGMPEELTVTKLDTGEKMDIQVRVAEAGVEEDDSIVGDLSEFANAPPRISRESILRKVRNTKYDFEDDSDVEESVLDAEEGRPRPSYAELAQMDPDQPIQSRENSRETSENYLPRHIAAAVVVDEPEAEAKIKAEPTDDDDGIDLNDIPAIDAEALQPPRSSTRMDDYDRQSSVVHHRVSSESASEDDDASHYSSMEPEAESTMLHNSAQDQHEPAHEQGKESLQDAMQLLTVKDYSAPAPAQAEATRNGELPRNSFMGLPAYLSSDEYDFGMGAYIAPSPRTASESAKRLDWSAAPMLQPSRHLTHPADLSQQPCVAPEVSPPGTPDSVIQHRTSDVSSLYEQVEEQFDAQPEPEAEPEVIIPERRATIKTGGKLKARPSVSRADLEAMGQHRMVSGDEPMPAMPSAYRTAVETEVDDRSVHSTEKADSLVEGRPDRGQSGKLQLDVDIPQLAAGGTEDLALRLETEFDKVIESQKVRLAPFPPPLFARFDASGEQKQSNVHSAASADANMPSPPTHHSRSAGANSYSPRPQKGYLMRQNTKLVVASNRNFSNDSSGTNRSADSNATTTPMSPTTGARPARGTRSAGNSPRKPSAEQFLKTEPWNGKTRRKSLRQASAQKAAFSREHAAPPLPGQESAALGVVDEDVATATTGSLDDEMPEGTERGRLFVKVVGVKDLDLPLPRNDRVHFQLTLDNGLHCVTTADLELGRSAPIGQEFELVVQEDLEFQLTLTTKLSPPPKAPATPTPSSPTKSARSQKAGGGFAARFLSSPRKRAERERREREAAEAEEKRARDEAHRKRASAHPTAWDLLHELVNAPDGSFARSYVNLKTHERECFGRQLRVDVPCYNEWALETDSHVVNSVRSKRGAARAGEVRRPPYVVGKLELVLVYVPRLRGVGEEGMPKSMGGAVREMGKAEQEERERWGGVRGGVGGVVEGCLSQEGGDCAHWRRRFFRLQGSRLIAYHEHTHQKRAVINLAKASRLVDDKSTLVANPASNNISNGKAPGRRKSAFAEEDEAYQYVEEGFRIRFANGETIDFYADSGAEKERWMRALSQVIGKPSVPGEGDKKKEVRWTDVVLARERAAKDSKGAATSVGASEEGSASGSSSSPVKPSPMPMVVHGGTEVKDFTRSAVQRRQSGRQPVPHGGNGSKSAPTSPLKGGPPTQRPPPPPAAAVARPRTPPMASRSGHRSRDAVKSMIF